MLCEGRYTEIFQCSYLALSRWEMLSDILLSANTAFDGAFTGAFALALALPLYELIH